MDARTCTVQRPTSDSIHASSVFVAHSAAHNTLYKQVGTQYVVVSDTRELSHRYVVILSDDIVKNHTLLLGRTGRKRLNRRHRGAPTSVLRVLRRVYRVPAVHPQVFDHAYAHTHTRAHAHIRTYVVVHSKYTHALLYCRATLANRR